MGDIYREVYPPEIHGRHTQGGVPTLRYREAYTGRCTHPEVQGGIVHPEVYTTRVYPEV